MPDLSELKERLQRMEDAIRLKLPDIATLISLSAKAFAERTIKDKGFGETYSTNEIPTWFFTGKENNKAGETYIEQNEFGTWSGFRAAQGLQTAHVDLSYTNTMWASMLPQEPYEAGGIYYAPLAGGNSQTQDEMNWNFERYGDFVGRALTPEHFQALIQAAYDELIRVIEEAGLILNKS